MLVVIQKGAVWPVQGQHGAAFLCLLGQLQPLVAFGHNGQAFFHRRGLLVVFNHVLCPVYGGNNGATASVVTGYVELLTGQLVADVDHASAGVGGVFAVREAGNQSLEIAEGVFRSIHVLAGAIGGDHVVKQAFLHVEVGQPAHVEGIVHAWMRGVVAHEALRRDHGGRVVHGLVLGVDQVQRRLFGIVPIRKARLQLLELVDGRQVVFRFNGLAGLPILIGLGEFRAIFRVAGATGQNQYTQ